MDTNKVTLKEMIQAAKQPENDDVIMRLLNRIKSPDLNVQELKDEAELLDEMFENWDEAITRSDDKADFCVRMAELNVLSSDKFRTSLHLAVKKLLPPYLTSGSVIKAIGSLDKNVSVRDAALRLRKLQYLRSTALMYQQDTHQWGKINNIDKVTGMLAISGLHSSSVSSVPIASTVVSCYFFNTTPEFLNLLFPGAAGRASADKYKKLFAANSLTEISEQKIRDIVSHLLVPASMSAEEFEKWWNTDVKPAASAASRSYADARSVLELYTLISSAITEEHPKLSPLSEETSAKLIKLYPRFRNMSDKEVSMLMECIAQIANSGSEAELLKKTFAPLRGKVPFWPGIIAEHMDMRNFESWGHLSAKLLPAFASVTGMLYTEQEMMTICILLPLRCLGVCMEKISGEIITESLLKLKNMSSDIILWIWKNRAHLNKRLVECIDMGRIATALSQENLPREWTAAQRDLKKHTFEKKDFQEFLIENANGDIPSIISALRRCRSFQGGERQSLMVKLGRYSKELKDYIEGGEGKKLMGAAAEAQSQALITSIKSHKRLMAEYEKLINVDIPENSAAVALARSFGDLRENAEYEAAKERRTYLNRRRVELDKTLGVIQSTNFKDVKVDEHVVLGSVVRLTSAKGEKIEYFVLGAWDGDPEKNYIAYTAPIGQILLHKKTGETLTLPDGTVCTIQEVLPLPETIRKDLALEE